MAVREKVKELLRSRGLTVVDLAKLAGISRTTCHNLLSGRSKSVTARRALTNAIGVQLWDGVEPRRVTFIFPKGTEMEFPESESFPGQFESEFRGFVQRDGNVFRFLRKTPVEITPHEPLLAAENKASD